MDMRLFLRGEGVDDKGRLLSEMWSYTLAKKEWNHTYIQRMFPLDEPSMHNNAPTITREEALSCSADEKIVKNMRTSYETMLMFYGLSDDCSCSYFSRWIKPRNHNFLRITRIIKSLRLFGLNREAEDFYHRLLSMPSEYKKIIPDKTWQFWLDATKY